jgi:hypothetical protein
VTTSSTPSPIIEHRTEAIALVALTRNPDVNPKRVDLGDIDFLTFIPGEDPDEGFRFFGVIVKGTQKLGSVEAANIWANKADKSLRSRDAFYIFPTMLLLCSVVDESAYFAWVMEPFIERKAPRLKKNRKLHFELLNADALAAVVETVREWYEAAMELAE